MLPDKKVLRVSGISYRSAGGDYYDDEDEGADGIDTFLKNLPQILISVIVIMIAYFVWSFFNSPTGSALGDAVGDLVGMFAQMTENWRLFLLGYVLIALVPAVGRGIAYVADKIGDRSTGKSLQKFRTSKMLQSKSTSTSLRDIGEKSHRVTVAVAKTGLNAKQTEEIHEIIRNHAPYEERDGNVTLQPLPDQVQKIIDLSPGLQEMCMEPKAAIATLAFEDVNESLDNRVQPFRSETQFKLVSQLLHGAAHETNAFNLPDSVKQSIMQNPRYNLLMNMSQSLNAMVLANPEGARQEWGNLKIICREAVDDLNKREADKMQQDDRLLKMNEAEVFNTRLEKWKQSNPSLSGTIDAQKNIRR